MGSIYQKKGRLYIRYKDGTGAWRSAAAGVPVGEEEQAQALLDQVEAKLAAAARLGVAAAAPEVETVHSWGERWHARRKAKGLTSAKDDRARLVHHINPALGGIPLGELRPRHVRKLVEDLKLKPSTKGGTLSARTVRAVYSMLHTMLEDAVAEELIAANPCKIRRGELPRMVDKDPEWRINAVFSRGEVEQLISHPDIPEDRRVLYGILGLGGLRFGEAAALRWRSYDKPREPLGRLVVAVAYNTREKRVGTTKTGVVRIVPVHPTLARLLAGWKVGGWETTVGRRPEPDDLIIPPLGRTKASHRPVAQALRQLLVDLKMLGLRPRRVHDLRRAFISLARDAGAAKDLVALITHTPSSSDVMESYSSLHWGTVCATVSGIKVGLREGEVVELRQAVGAPSMVVVGQEEAPPRAVKVTAKGGQPLPGAEPVRAPELATPLLPSTEAKKEPRKSEDLRGSTWWAILESKECRASLPEPPTIRLSQGNQGFADHATEQVSTPEMGRIGHEGSNGNKPPRGGTAAAWALITDLASLPRSDDEGLASLIDRAKRLLEESGG